MKKLFERMIIIDKFKGQLPALVTPVDENGRIKEKSLKELIDYLFERGVDGLYLGGSTGEGLILQPEIRKKFVEIVADYVEDEHLVIAHIGSINSDDVLELAEHAGQVGVDAISAVPPFYYELDLKGIKMHYQKISEITETPMLLYNIPSKTGVAIDAEKMEELIKIDNVFGLKFTTHNLFEMSKIKQLDREIVVFNGSDEMTISGLAMGADGSIGTFLNIMPGLFVKLNNLMSNNKIEEAREIQYNINKIIDICLNYRSSLMGIKEILSMMGFDVGTASPPLRPLSSSESKKLKKELEKANFFEMIK